MLSDFYTGLALMRCFFQFKSRLNGNGEDLAGRKIKFVMNLSLADPVLAGLILRVGDHVVAEN